MKCLLQCDMLISILINLSILLRQHNYAGFLIKSNPISYNIRISSFYKRMQRHIVDDSAVDIPLSCKPSI